MAISPYDGLDPVKWEQKTKSLIAVHPLSSDELVEVVLKAWQDIFKSQIGGFSIGAEIFPKPQILGFLLHELIPLELQSRYPKVWRPEKDASDKDVNHLTDQSLSIEIKTSSSAGKIFGNRSYAKGSAAPKKDKSGYYLAVNFSKCEPKIPKAEITVIRFGWLDHQDWKGQQAQSGQQASLSSDVETKKLLTLFNK